MNNSCDYPKTYKLPDEMERGKRYTTLKCPDAMDFDLRVLSVIYISPANIVDNATLTSTLDINHELKGREIIVYEQWGTPMGFPNDWGWQTHIAERLDFIRYMAQFQPVLYEEPSVVKMMEKLYRDFVNGFGGVLNINLKLTNVAFFLTPKAYAKAFRKSGGVPGEPMITYHGIQVMEVPGDGFKAWIGMSAHQ